MVEAAFSKVRSEDSKIKKVARSLLSMCEESGAVNKKDGVEGRREPLRRKMRTR
jgi:hypothetical protein